MDVSGQGVLCIHPFLHFLVLIRKFLRFTEHLFNLLLGQAALVVGDGNLLRLSGALVFRANVQNAVGVNLKGHFDLWLTTGSWRDTAELKLAQQVVVLGHGALALENLDKNSGLVVLVGGEDLRLLGWDHSVSGDQLGHYTSNGLNAQSQGGHVQQQQILSALAAQDSGLHGRTIGDSFIRVDAAVGLLTVEEILDQLLHLGDTSRATHQHDFVHLVLLQT
mmetsp:Transcript_24119/g.50071  ORF Transcript_24119/g.50071 Transcript_24119/m.50071 type:complete len:221 (-) Transcript_24119:245-907(-)